LSPKILLLVGGAEASILPVLLALSLVILTAKAFAAFAVRLGQPAVLGELVAGIVLGPTFLDLLGLPLFEGSGVETVITNLGQIGVIGLMFAAGLEIELRDLRVTGKPAVLGGMLGVLAPMLFGSALGLLVRLPLEEALFIGLILSATSVSISAQTLLELRQLRTREGIALLGAAVIDDILVLMLLSIFVVGVTGEGSLLTILGQLGLMLLVLVLVFLFALILLPRAAQLSTRLKVSEGLLAVVFSVVLLMAWATEHFGQVAGITGAFIAGVGLARSAYRAELERSLHTLNFGFFVPIFLVDIGLRADISALNQSGLIFAVGLIIVAVFSKILGSGVGARLGGFSLKESLRMGIGMVSRGEVGLIVAGIGSAQGILPADQFTMIVLMVLFTTLITPLLLRWAYQDGERKDG
jgi:Kef-type K+ transport system membrane component KefB